MQISVKMTHFGPICRQNTVVTLDSQEKASNSYPTTNKVQLFTRISFLFDNLCSVLTLGWLRSVSRWKIELYQLSLSRVLTIFMLLLTGAPPSSSPVFIYSPGSLSIIITRYCSRCHDVTSVALPMFVCNVISGHFNPIHFTTIRVISRLWELLAAVHSRGNNEAHN